MVEQRRIKINGIWATVNVPDSLLEQIHDSHIKSTRGKE